VKKMTAKRDLKRLVRERQDRTGESYMTALRQVRSQRVPAVPVVELIDLSEIAEALGIKCRVRLQPSLAERIDAAAVLRQLRAALLATVRDPAFDLMRSVVLHGECPPGRPPRVDEVRRFLVRVRAGVGGISGHGRLLALTVDGRRGAELVLFFLWLPPTSYTPFPPSLFLTAADGGIYELGDLRLEWR
jgi:hypothetical protein